MKEIKKLPYAPEGDWRLEEWGYLKGAKSMNSFAKNGDIIYDCGANIFDHSIFFALNNPNSTIIAFEPISEYFSLGLKNAEYFNVKNIIPLNVALGEVVGEANISLENESSSLVTGGRGPSAKIFVETIDNLVLKNKIPAPNLIKIDVEGFALPLLKGARETIEKFKPTIIMEVHPQFVGMEQTKEKFIFLRSLGMNVVDVLDDGREYVIKYGDSVLDFNRCLFIAELNEIRYEYDHSNSKEERISIKARYIEIKKSSKIPLGKRLLWSQIYNFFKFKK